MRARRTYFVPGYYNESLTEELYSTGGFQPALLVDLDCDLYISTIQALEWLFKHRILRVESVVRYDDWPHPRSAASSSGGGGGSAAAAAGRRLQGLRSKVDPSSPIRKDLWGQALAHAEITYKYRVVFKHLGRDAFQIKAIGASKPDPDMPKYTTTATQDAAVRADGGGSEAYGPAPTKKRGGGGSESFGPPPKGGGGKRRGGKKSGGGKSQGGGASTGGGGGGSSDAGSKIPEHIARKALKTTLVRAQRNAVEYGDLTASQASQLMRALKVMAKSSKTIADAISEVGWKA